MAASTLHGQVAAVDLQGKLDAGRSELIIAVANRDSDTHSFHWYIDEQPVTASAVPRAGELVFFVRPSPASTCRVVVVDATGATSIGIIRLDPAVWTPSTPNAPSRVNVTRVVL